MIKKHQEVFSILKKRILRGVYKEKLPSIRNLIEEFSYNKSTILKALEELKEENLIEIKPCRGIYLTSHKNFEKMEKLTYEIDFKSAVPRGNIFPLEQFKESILKTLEFHGAKALEYEENQGYLLLRELISKKLEKLNIFENKENIFIVPGSQMAIEILAKALLYPGEIVGIETPYYPGAYEIFKNLGYKIIEIPMESDGIDLKYLEKILKKYSLKFLYTVPNFHNPTGITMSLEKMKKLIELSKKYNFYILEDDTMSELNYFQESKLLKSYDNLNKVIYLKSFSKIFNPGFKLGYVVIPKEIKLSFEKIFFKKNYFSSSLNQRAFYDFYKSSHWDNHIIDLKETFKEKYLYTLGKLKEMKKIKFNKNLNGGLYFWIEIKNLDTYKLYLNLMKKNIGISPGIFFSDNFKNYFRFSFAREDINKIQKGIEELKEIFKISSKYNKDI